MCYINNEQNVFSACPQEHKLIHTLHLGLPLHLSTAAQVSCCYHSRHSGEVSSPCCRGAWQVDLVLDVGHQFCVWITCMTSTAIK